MFFYKPCYYWAFSKWSAREFKSSSKRRVLKMIWTFFGKSYIGNFVGICFCDFYRDICLFLLFNNLSCVCSLCFHLPLPVPPPLPPSRTYVRDSMVQVIKCETSGSWWIFIPNLYKNGQVDFGVAVPIYTPVINACPLISLLILGMIDYLYLPSW